VSSWYSPLGGPEKTATLTGTRVRLLGHQAAEIVLFCLLFAIAVFAVIAAVYSVTSSALRCVFDWWRYRWRSRFQESIAQLHVLIQTLDLIH
jgi:hypothetical protein